METINDITQDLSDQQKAFLDNMREGDSPRPGVITTEEFEQMWRDEYAKCGVPRRYLNGDFATEAARQNWGTKPIGFFVGIKSIYSKFLDRIIAGERINLVGKDKKISVCSLLLTGGDRAMKGIYAADIAKSCRKGDYSITGRAYTVRYYSFAEIRAQLSDYNKAHLVDDLVDAMTCIDLVVIEGVHNSRTNGVFESNWERLISARYLSARPTILVCEEGYEDIDSYSWRNMISDPEMFPINFDKFCGSPQNTKPAVAAPVAQSHTATKQKYVQVDLSSLNEDDRAVLEYIAANPRLIQSRIAKGVNMSYGVVATHLQTLESIGAIKQFTVQGKTSKLIVFEIAIASGAIPTADGKAVEVPVRQLARELGLHESTLRKYKKQGLTDDEIRQKAAETAAEKQ
jgi:hypothetical protein